MIRQKKKGKMLPDAMEDRHHRVIHSAIGKKNVRIASSRIIFINSLIAKGDGKSGQVTVCQLFQEFVIVDVRVGI